MQTELSADERLTCAKELVESLEAGELERSDQLIRELARDRNQDLFQEVGRLTRELHETLNNFFVDNRLTSLVESGMPDARERLNYVIEMTEEAAHKTLGAVEDCLPTLHGITERAGDFKASWEKFRRREMPLQQFRELSRNLDSFLEDTLTEAQRVEKNLSSVMMAQGTQDLAGQVIRQVIQLVQEVETNLVEIIRITGQSMGTTGSSDYEPQKSQNGYGPSVPGVDVADVAQSQDEVDELLSSLGF